jgi:hypothetical protein
VSFVWVRSALCETVTILEPVITVMHKSRNCAPSAAAVTLQGNELCGSLDDTGLMSCVSK